MTKHPAFPGNKIRNICVNIIRHSKPLICEYYAKPGEGVAWPNPNFLYFHNSHNNINTTRYAISRIYWLSFDGTWDGGYQSSVRKFLCKQNVWPSKSTCYIISITFKFYRCRRSSDTSQIWTWYLIANVPMQDAEHHQNNGREEIGLVTPHPGMWMCFKGSR